MVYIYALVDPNDLSIRYIGQTFNLEERLSNHIYETLFNIKQSKKLTHKENWIKKLLNSNQSPLIVELDTCNKNDWEKTEIWWINLCRSINLPLTNLSDGGKSIFRGRNHSEESKRKISKKLKGRIKSDETRKKLSESLKGIPLTENHKKAISEAVKGKKNHNYGKQRSVQTRLKISEGNKGKIVSEETRKKMSNAHKGKNHSEETKMKISIKAKKQKGYWKNKNLSEETKMKMSLSHKMNSALKNNDLFLLNELQEEYKNIFGFYQVKYKEYIL